MLKHLESELRVVQGLIKDHKARMDYMDGFDRGVLIGYRTRRMTLVGLIKTALKQGDEVHV